MGATLIEKERNHSVPLLDQVQLSHFGIIGPIKPKHTWVFQPIVLSLLQKNKQIFLVSIWTPVREG